jgi:cell division protein FtsA
MKNRIISAIDIGTAGVKIMVARSGQNGLEILANHRVPVLGVRRGVVDKVDAVSEAITSAVKEAETQINRKLDSVFVNINGSHLFCELSSGKISVSRADRRISEEDAERVLQQAQTVPISSNKEILETMLQQYIIDGEGGLRQVVDIHGTCLEADVLLVGGFSGHIRNSLQAVVGAGLQDVVQLVGPLSSAIEVLSPQEKEMGVLLLDIGESTTSFVVYHEDILVGLAVFPIGSGDITRDLAIGLQTDIDTAEKVKLEYYGQKKKKMDGIKFTERDLEKIVKARLKDIFNKTNEELKKINLNGRLPGGIVLTGGGSQLTGLVDIVKKEMKLPVRRVIDEPELSVLKGMIKEGLITDNAPAGRAISGWLKRFFTVFIP